MNRTDHGGAQREQLQQMAQCIFCLRKGINHLLSSVWGGEWGWDLVLTVPGGKMGTKH